MKPEQLEPLLSALIPKKQVKCQLIDLVAYASDAGFYYLRPKAVVLPDTEEQIIQLFLFSQQYGIPLVFRTAGTSLSGQSVTDGILVDLSQYWDQIVVEKAGELVRVQPGAVGSVVNARLSRYGRKIGPDPASITSAMMGGIISNNSSGMCCGVSKNAYHTTKYIRFILPNGKLYTTENQQDYQRFSEECPALSQQLKVLRQQIFDQPLVLERIRQKYQTKNTVGYGLNAFVDFTEPLDIMAHLLIGAEGTLGFIAEAVLESIPDYPEKSTALLYFSDIYAACRAIEPLTLSGAAAVELMDRASLRSIEHIAGVPELIKSLGADAAALLVEYHAATVPELQEYLAHFESVSESLALLTPASFTTVKAEQALLWKVRKGMFPSVGAVRARGTTVILEDVAFPVSRLGDAILDLQVLFKKYQYDNAIIFGHAKDGNIHFVVTQAFDTQAEITRYHHFLSEVVALVVNKYEGTLKAEHGTGRNMAPFVETEWGGEIYQIMKAIKLAVDPDNLLNPGVIINENKSAHITNLKGLTQVEKEVDQCMECGFCEQKCPSRNLTLTPRKRIVVRRELIKLKNTGVKKEYAELLKQYQYQGLDTCAVDGLCATACPVDINTGDLVKRLRRENHSAMANKVAVMTAVNFRLVATLVRTALAAGLTMNRIFGKRSMIGITSGLKSVIPAFPLWSNQLALAKKLRVGKQEGASNGTVVYFPSCISRTMGEPDPREKGVMQTLMDVSAKAGIHVLLPSEVSGMCCGQIYSSKGFYDAYTFTVNQTIEQLWLASSEGRFGIVLDISSCTQTLLNCRAALSPSNQEKFDAMKIMDSIDYLHDYILPHVAVGTKKKNIVVHPVCSLQKMSGLEVKFTKVASHFAENVTVPLFAGCCGMAGDRGFLHPELTQSATAGEASEVKAQAFDGYYSSSKTCEIALSEAVGKNYYSILRLVDECAVK